MSPIVAAALVVFFEGIAVAAVFPVLHAYTAELGGGAFWVGVLFALVTGPKIFLNPCWGNASDRFGRRRVLVVITLGTLAGSVGWALAGSLLWLAGARLIVGLFSSQAVVAAAIVGDTASRGGRAGGMAALGAGFGLAITLGPAIGGIVGEGISYRAVGWICAASQLLSILVITLGLRETRASGMAEPPLLAMLALLRNAHKLRLLLATSATTTGFSLLMSIAGLHTKAFFGFTTRHAGYALAFVGLLSVLVQGGAVRPLVHRFREYSVTAVGMVFAAIGFAAIGADQRLYTFVFAIGMVAIGSALTVPCLSALLSHAVGADEQGAIQGLNQSFTAIGRTLGFFAGPAVWAAFGARACFLSAAVVMILGLIALPQAAYPAEKPRARAPVPAASREGPQR